MKRRRAASRRQPEPRWYRRLIALHERGERRMDRMEGMLDRHLRSSEQDRRQAADDRRLAADDRRQAARDRADMNASLRMIARTLDALADSNAVIAKHVPRQTALLEKIAHTLRIMSNSRPGPNGS